MINREKARQVRTIATQFTARDGDGDNAPHISGYFALYNSIYEIAPGMTESIAPGAFSRTLGGDVRALVNHDTTLVLGRTKVKTLELRDDERGLWGDIAINPNDGDAMNLHARVKRGDVDQCSFGCIVISEEIEFRDDGSVHWTITDVILLEVSACTFPAYEETNISARSAERDAIQKKRLEAWKNEMKGRIAHGIEGSAAEKAD